MQTAPRQRLSSNRHAAALVIVLAFVVLLTVLVVAFFSRVMSERSVSNSSANETKVDLLAHGALNAILGDLKQEIVAGSASDTQSGVTIYTPTNAANAMPALAVTGTTSVSGTSFAANVLKRSAYRQPFYAGANYDTGNYPAPDRAANLPTTGTSQNGRVITPTRWNKGLLLPKKNAASATDFTPDPGQFIPPDWILIARDGSNPKPATVTGDLTTTGTNPVLGRYAYVVYNEGGLLDANVAGYPGSLVGATTSVSARYKNSLAFADLTQLGLNQSQVDALVGWRNWASAQPPGGSFLTPGFTAASGSNYYNFVISNTSGFLTVSNSALFSGQSDRMFASRQQLISFLTSNVGTLGGNTLAATQNTLQYLGSFSRDINQPSFAPDPNRPKILSNTATDNYAGNDAAGHDNDFNPPFLSIRVANTFTRNDGSQAGVGEPLVKKRFNLNRLAWITYQGPSATRNLTDVDMQQLINAGIKTSMLQQGTAANIQTCFGLTWDDTNHYWTYNHGITGSAGQPIIGYMSKIRDANREPDFFELLKAGINAGAIAKGATDPNGLLEESSGYLYDTKVDYAILQVGANIIDQFDTDGYPTRIRFNDGSRLVEFRGTENLPYFYRVRSDTVISALPDPLPIASGTSDLDPWTSPSSLKDCGFFAVFWQPEVWNPYDANCSLGNPRPTNLRIVADSAPLDADGNAIGSYNPLRVYTQCNHGGRRYVYDDINHSREDFDPIRTPHSYVTDNRDATVKWQGSNTELTFTDFSGTLFRQPTLFSRPGIPTNSNLAIGPGNLMVGLFTTSLAAYWQNGSTGSGVKCINDPNTGGQATPYIGFYYGQGPLRWVSQKENVILTVTENDAYGQSISGSPAVTFRVQCSDGTNWMTYDEKYVTNLEQSQSMGIPTQSSASMTSSVGSEEFAGTSDPRTRRFGAPGAGNRGGLTASKITWLDKNQNTLVTDRPDIHSGWGWYSSTTTKSMPNVGGWYAEPAKSWMLSPPTGTPPTLCYRPALLSQNNPNVMSDSYAPQQAPSSWDSAPSPEYYTDPDGVVRRGMSAYVAGSGTAPAATTIGLPLATGTATPKQTQSRPMMLNRPFRSAAELGYVFSGTPWKNLSMFTPESGESALLDVFCVEPDDTSSIMVAGKINLNTRQKPVLQAILAGSYIDELSTSSTSILSGTAQDTATIADLHVSRIADLTTPGKGPLANVASLVGHWNSAVTASLGGIDGAASYSGPIGDWISTDLSTCNIQRLHEAPVRALANAGTTRVWSLMIDLVAQTGRYTAFSNDPNKFVVEGERRYWIHLAIDRYTGRVIDQQWESVQE